MSIYEQHRVPHVWLINPIITTLEAYKPSSEGRFRFAMVSGNKRTGVEPFRETEIDLGILWGTRRS